MNKTDLTKTNFAIFILAIGLFLSSITLILSNRKTADHKARIESLEQKMNDQLEEKEE